MVKKKKGYILDPLYVGAPGGGIIKGAPWEPYLNPVIPGKWVGKAVMINPLNQNVILETIGPLGTWTDLYWGTVSYLLNMEFNFRKVDEWVEISPVHKGFYDLVMSQRQALESKVKGAIDEIIKQSGDLELLEHDLRRYREFKDYFDNNDEHSLKAIFIDQVDYYTGEGAPGRLSMVFFQQQNIFPTIIQDFYEMRSEEDLEKGRLGRLPKVEKDVLRTKWRAYQEWKRMFRDEVEKRFQRIGQLVESKRRLLESMREGIKPYIARLKLLRQGLQSQGLRKDRETNPFHPAVEATSQTIITLWAWKEMSPPDFYKAPGEFISLKNIRPDDPWTLKHLVFDENLGLKEKYPWITGQWVKDKIYEIMNVDDWFRARKRTNKTYLYYVLLELIFDKWTSRSATGSEIEDVAITARSYWMSQNVLLVKLLELKAKEQEFEWYIDELLGIKKPKIVKSRAEKIAEIRSGIREKKKEIDILRRDLTKVDDEKRKADINRKIKELRVEINKLNAELRTLQKEEISRIEKIMDNISGFFGKLGLNFKLFNKGPYEHRFDKRVTKFYLIATGRNYFGPVTSFIRKKMLS